MPLILCPTIRSYRWSFIFTSMLPPYFLPSLSLSKVRYLVRASIGRLAGWDEFTILIGSCPS